MDATPPESSDPNPGPKTFLVFGDLHGRILPAFRLANCWAKEFHRPLHGILQVGDLGYFPNPSRLDNATIRHAKDDPLELGALDIVAINDLADSILDDPVAPPGLWFTAGNHEDFEELERLALASGKQPDFVVDAYCRVRGIKDGAVATVASCRVGAVWGVDRQGRNARRKLPDRGFIQSRAIDRLLVAGRLDVLLTHDAPLGAKREEYGSELLSNLIQLAQPQFAFFGHYSGDGAEVEKDYGRTRVFHMAGFELRESKDRHAETGSVGVLTWNADEPEFEYLSPKWLRTFNRGNWKWR
ncbi:metallophosphoesterase [Limnoglobus roseus]|uniref:Calcineurin-like phosphoesterase domain-containing protein n=1 Tax=Limnoglobus roseus TaxID=2598579 RepID=A0A5C1A8B1_9BACT|nr:metallophosphoesterase [Limnoglobus roseus]QEL14423.1 hypothetical protein PX52LOC_01311 [Limnoglobus roseus]